MQNAETRATGRPGLPGELPPAARGSGADIAAAVEGFDPLAVDPRRCREAAEAFDADQFSSRLRSAVDAALRGDRVMRA